MLIDTIVNSIEMKFLVNLKDLENLFRVKGDEVHGEVFRWRTRKLYP